MSGVEKGKEFFDQAFILEQEGKLEEALSACEKALQENRNYADAHNLRGIVLERLGRKEDALSAYQEAIWADPNFEEAQENLNALKAEKRAPAIRMIKTSAKVGLFCALACALIFGWTEAMRLAIFPLDYSGQNYWIPYIAYIFLSPIQFGLSCLFFALLTKPTGRANASLISGLIAGIPYALITLAFSFLLRFGILDFDPLSVDYFIWAEPL